jgi:propane monooxygenase reductase subunit
MAIVKKQKATVISIENKIEGVYTLTFASEKGFRYSPGQFLHLAIDTDYDGSGQWPESRCFSLQSSPNDENAKITYALKGDFTQYMEKELRVGSEVWLKLPYGELFEQEHNKSKTVFIAGGTGVTPFLSLFTDDSFRRYVNPRIYLGFRSEKYNLYQNELNNACNSTLEIQFVYENVIDIDKIFIENGVDASYFISGPPVMIKAFKQVLLKNGVAESNVLTDDWE